MQRRCMQRLCVNPDKTINLGALAYKVSISVVGLSERPQFAGYRNEKGRIKYTMIDNAFGSLEDAGKTQQISDNISIEKLHRKLDEFV